VVPYIESIIWGCQRCGIETGAVFSQIYCNNFLMHDPESVADFANVTMEVVLSRFIYVKFSLDARHF